MATSSLVSKLGPLYENCIVRSNERVQAHATIAKELSEYEIRWHGDNVDTRIYKLETPRLALYSMHYGSEVEILPQIYQGFSLVRLSLQGGIDLHADGGDYYVAPGQTILSSPSRAVHLRWPQACEQLVLRIPDVLLVESATQANLFDQATHAFAVKNTPAVMLDEAASRQWLAQLEAFVQLSAYARSDPALAAWLNQIEHVIALFLYIKRNDVAAARLAEHRKRNESPSGIWIQHAKRRADRLAEFAGANLNTPVTLDKLAQAAALSRRQLNELCQREFNMPPMEWLRQQRLDAIRRKLQQDPRADITATAMSYGFMNPGRFAMYYRKRFGELPSKTRQKDFWK